MAGTGVRLFLSGDTAYAADINTYLMDQVVARFATTAARDAAFGDGIPVSQGGSGKPALSEGRICYIDELNLIQYYNGASWQDSGQFTVGDGAITTQKLAANSVTSDKIAPGTVIAADIAAGTITATELADGAVTSGKILDGTIVNADVNASAAIALSKLANATAGQVLLGTTTTGVVTATTISGDVTVTGAGVTAISSGVIVDADINASAAIDKTKISGTAITAADTGTVTSTMISNGTIVNADINASASIDLGKLADATIDIKTANYSLVLTDKNKFIKMNSSSNRTITVPLQATVNFPEGSQIHLIRYGSGTLEIVGESGAVILYATPGKFLRAQYSSATLLKCADTNVWMLMGDLSAS